MSTVKPDKRQFEHKCLYVGPPLEPYAQDQINRAGQEGWELVQIIGYDAWVKRLAPDE